MDKSGGPQPITDNGSLSLLQRNLADCLTISRVVIGLVILSLSFAGKGAYILVVTLTFVGAATDILDGKVARYYLGENREGRLGRHDHEIDTMFLLCAFAYCTFAGIVIPRVMGLSLIILGLTAIVIFKGSRKIFALVEVPTVIALLVIALLYSIEVFVLFVVPVMAIGIIINRRRVIYLVFDYGPELFFK